LQKGKRIVRKVSFFRFFIWWVCTNTCTTQPNGQCQKHRLCTLLAGFPREQRSVRPLSEGLVFDVAPFNFFEEVLAHHQQQVASVLQKEPLVVAPFSSERTTYFDEAQPNVEKTAGFGQKTEACGFLSDDFMKGCKWVRPIKVSR